MSNVPSYLSGINTQQSNKRNLSNTTPSYASLATNKQSGGASTPAYASNLSSSQGASYASGNYNQGSSAPAYASSNSGSSYNSYGSGSLPSYASLGESAATNALYGSGLAPAAPTSYPTVGAPSTPSTSVPYTPPQNYNPPPANTTTPVNLGNYSAAGSSRPVGIPPRPNVPNPQQAQASQTDFFSQPPASPGSPSGASHFSKPPETKKPAQTPPLQTKQPSSGGGMFSKLALKAGQMADAGRNITKSKIDNISRKINSETDLNPPAAGFIAANYEELLSTTKFSTPEEIEFLYYEFCRHVHIPKQAAPDFVPMINFEQFVRMMPPCYNPASKEHYKLIIQSFFTVFKWGGHTVTFDSFVRAISIICRGTPPDKVPMLYDILMDPIQRTISVNSLRFVLTELSKLELRCPTAEGLVPGPREVEYLVNALFQDNSPVLSMQQFTQRVMQNLQNPQMFPPWKMLLDGFGLFPYIYTTFVQHCELFASKTPIPPGQMKVQPHKEGWLIKYTRTTLTDPWCRHWGVIDSGFLWYYPSHNKYDAVSKVIALGDCRLQISNDPADPPYCFAITTQGVTRRFCAESEESFDYWIHVIKLSQNHSSGSKKYRNDSFAPVRDGMSGRWFIDGEDTYRLMEETMLKATREIFITDWFFSPQVYTTRFDAQGRPTMEMEHRLDVILQKKANEGVKVYVLPWSETKIAIDLGSANVKAVLEKLSPNIKVLCHPLVAPIKWSHHQKTVIVDQKIAFVGGLDLCFGRWDTQRHSLTDTQQPYLFPGKDYYNPAVAEFSNVPNYQEEIVDRTKEPRMPWHDIHMMCEGDAARDVAANFIQRWNHHRDLLNEHRHIIPCNDYLPPSGKLSIQVVRSVCEWSAGVKATEKSILNAYMNEIDKAEHFIYIENQFFISSLAGSIVENQIANALLEKVFTAIAQNRIFRIIVIVPVHPEGGYKDTATVRYIMGWQYKTICRGGNSMVEEFTRRHPNLDITQYFHFYVVKKWDRLGERLVHEQIYVHAKLMIVDDRTVIVGSANINDRSLIGVRDSEIAVVIKDRQILDCAMNGQPFQVAKFAHELRCNLYLEHLGMAKHEINQVRDPIHPRIYDTWVNTAKENAAIFNEIFYKERTIDYSEEVERKLRNIKGHICEYDQDLLSDANMAKTTGVDVMFATDDIFV